MGDLLAKFVLPAALLAAGVLLFLRASQGGGALAYFFSAVLLGMAIASAQRAWGGKGRE